MPASITFQILEDEGGQVCVKSYHWTSIKASRAERSMLRNIRRSVQYIVNSRIEAQRREEKLLAALTSCKIAEIARQLGYTPKYLEGVLQCRRHGASPFLIEKLARMGITTTVDGEKL